VRPTTPFPRECTLHWAEHGEHKDWGAALHKTAQTGTAGPLGLGSESPPTLAFSASSSSSSSPSRLLAASLSLLLVSMEPCMPEEGPSSKRMM